MTRKLRNIQFAEEKCPLLEDTCYFKQNLIPQDNCKVQHLEGNTPCYYHVSEISLMELNVEQIFVDDIQIIPTETRKTSLYMQKQPVHLENINQSAQKL